jgi:hypothetical protein
MGNNQQALDAKDDGKKKPAHQHGQDASLYADSYNPPLNNRVMNTNGTIKPGACSEGPSLYSLTIDTTPGHVVVHDVPHPGDSLAERRAAEKREMPISNEHFRDLVKQGVEFMAFNDGGFNIQMRNALNEANQSDKSMHTGHNHVDNVLKYANSHLCDTFYTMRRKGNIVEVWDTHQSTKHPAGKWNLDKNAWER